MNRRDLFRPRSAAHALRAEGPSRESALKDVQAGAGDLLRASRPAMGSYFEIRLGANVPGALGLAERALDLIDRLEAQLTVYRDDSEVSLLNATAHMDPVAVEEGLFRLIETAVSLSLATGGAYDVTSGALSAAWGFFRGPKRVPDPGTLADARDRTGSHLLRLDRERRTVGFVRQGVVINFGSIGKGYAIDRVAALVRDYWWPTSALIHGGRSSLYALGSPPGTLGGRWEVALRNPFQPEQPLGVLRLRNRGMGTSGDDFQRFEADGRVYGHILDPRTGEPADGPAGVTVLAPTAAEADALSTAFYLLGPERAREFVKDRPEVGAVFVERAGTERGYPVTLVNVGEADFSPHPDCVVSRL
ncbi:MAG: FAD:protein FMN transferase [Isosphaeraceae bacterium]